MVSEEWERGYHSAEECDSPVLRGFSQRDRPAGFLAARDGIHPLPDRLRRTNGPVCINAKLSQIDAPP